MDEDQNQNGLNPAETSLEAPGTEVSTQTPSTEPVVTDAAKDAAPPPASDQPLPSAPKTGLVRRLIKRLNIYLLLFLLIFLIAVVIVVVAYLDNKHSSSPVSLSSQSLNSNTLKQLASGETDVGSSGQVLNVSSSAVFASNVLARQDLEVAGNLQIGGTLALNNIAAAGTAQFGQLAVNGDSNLQGSLSVAKNLQVNGSGTFSGSLSAPQVTTSSLQLNGNLVLTHHVTIGGATPAKSDGSALGGGGTSSVSGSDSSGSITVNTGANPPAGCFVTISFNSPFSSTPHILITPIGSAAGSLNYYVTRSSSGFSICDSSAPPAQSTFGFDYLALD